MASHCLQSNCTASCRYQLNPLYVLITVIAYMMKDRMKEWGKRYLQPVCVKFGFEFPDRIVRVRPHLTLSKDCPCCMAVYRCMLGWCSKICKKAPEKKVKNILSCFTWVVTCWVRQ